MIYCYDERVNSLLKAGFLYAHTGQFPIYEGEANTSLFSTDMTHVRDVPWEDIYRLDNSYKHKKDDITKGQILHIIFYNLRHKSLNKHQLIVAAIKELTEIKPYTWLTGTTDIGLKMLRNKSDVGREIHKMVGYIRFVPLGDNFLVGTAPLEHQTADLILIRFRKRYPTHKLGLIVSDKACILNPDDTFTIEDGQKYIKLIGDDNFKDIWKQYYSSQYIKERKNIKYVQSSIPKKYWGWLDEGSIIAKEKNNN